MNIKKVIFSVSLIFVTTAAFAQSVKQSYAFDKP
jgi:hypothetical protein